MRITNKIIANNSLTNINNNKVYEDALNNQVATGCKIGRPSDDPVIAIRALRLRTDLSQTEQFYKRNIPDAESWLEITEGAVSTTIDVIKDMYNNCTIPGSVGFKTSEDREKFLENLKALQEEVYATADADYAGRYVFSGYRTNVPITFGQATEQQYTITEQVTKDSLDKITYVDIDNLKGMTAANAQAAGVTERDVDDYSVYRLRLAYDNCDAAFPDGTGLTITYYDAADAATAAAAGVDYNGTQLAVTPISAHDPTQDPYMIAKDAPNGVVFIPETGELVLSEDAYNKLIGTQDDKATKDVNEGEIRITYSKTDFKAKDLRPEHFFYCETGGIKYNEGYLTGDTSDEANQYISYDVGYNQSVRVNTLASEVFSPAIGRDVDDLIHSMEDVISMEKTISMLKNEMKDNPNDTDLPVRLAAAEKAYTLLEDKMQKLFEKNITNMQNHMDKANAALTDVGNRGSRVELVSNRLAKQKVSFEELTSENEDIDIAEATIQLASVEVAYNAALMATGKITKTTLLNYL